MPNNTFFKKSGWGKPLASCEWTWNGTSSDWLGSTPRFVTFIAVKARPIINRPSGIIKALLKHASPRLNQITLIITYQSSNENHNRTPHHNLQPLPSITHLLSMRTLEPYVVTHVHYPNLSQTRKTTLQYQKTHWTTLHARPEAFSEKTRICNNTTNHNIFLFFANSTNQGPNRLRASPT